MSSYVPSIASLGDGCCGCGSCAAKCPKGCIKMKADRLGFMRPEFSPTGCIGCGACDRSCPALKDKKDDPTTYVIWAKSNNREELLESSSGGVFTLLSKSVLTNGGIVIGAAWDTNCRSVKHIVIDCLADLPIIMRSKYVQSIIGQDVYESVRAALNIGRAVLFAGTSCQVSAMRAYLGKLADLDHFLTVDVVCHGVPAPLLWEKWLAYKEDRANGALTSVNMRNKNTGWSSYSTSYVFRSHAVDGSTSNIDIEDSSIFDDDWYMKAFLSNVCLRPSCYMCPSKLACGSDITLGDYWGIQVAHPEVESECGVSAVLCHTPKGVHALNNIKSYLEWGESSFEAVLDGNPSLIASVSPPQQRDSFTAELENGTDIETMIAKYSFKTPFYLKIRWKLGALKKCSFEH